MMPPRLRFKEFRDDWKSSTIDDVLGIFSGFAFSSNDALNDGARWLKIADVGIQKMTPNNPSYLPLSFKEVYKKFLVRKGDYVVALTRPILGGELKIAKIDDLYHESLLNQRVGKIFTNESLEFIYYLLHQKKTVLKIGDSISGSDPPNLSVEAIKKINVYIPETISEQNKIASFMLAVDEKITQLTKKHELLTCYKKGVMQKIFSQELRFKADDGSDYPDWVYIPLEEVLEYIQPTPYLVDSTAYSDEYSTPVLTAGKTFILGYTNETKGIFNKPLPALIFDDFTTALKFVNFPFKAKSSAMKILVSKSKNSNIRFVFEAMQLLGFVTGDEHKRYWISEYSKLEIPFPSLEEQTKIANFLSAIDEKIQNTQSQLEATKQYKQGLLQQMLV
jgi:type I restriction enzyme S subunit